MPKPYRPRKGSLAFSPRKRAAKETPRIRSWPLLTKPGLLGFAGYKAGMTHVVVIDQTPNSPTKGMDVCLPVTIVESPPIYVAAIRAYASGYDGLEVLTEIWAPQPLPELRRRITLPEKFDKDLSELEPRLNEVVDVRLICCTQPKLLCMPKKTPDVFEVGLGGGSVEEKFELAKSLLGKEVRVGEVLSEGSWVDVTAVTKGKGFQGVVKRWGVKMQKRKSKQMWRHVGTGGAWTPPRKLWREPLPGQMGYHVRTEHNKLVLRIGEDGKDVTPKGGFLRYGEVRNTYVMLYGSIPGPAKRLVRLTLARRPPKRKPSYDILYIETLRR